MALRASLSLGIPDWFIYYWYGKVSVCDWRMSNGRKMTRHTWKGNLLSWWSHKTPLERAAIENEYKEAVKSAAEGEDIEPEPKIEFTRRHWSVCQKLCLNYKHAKCLCGGTRPACFCASTNGFTEKCRGFKPVPIAWQNVWVLEPSEWEAHKQLDGFGRPWTHPGWKTTVKGRMVKAYFEAHPEELEEAKWRMSANEATEKEIRDANVYLSWLERARSGGKKSAAECKEVRQ